MICLLIGCGGTHANERVSDDVDQLIDLLAISAKPAGNDPIYSPTPATPRNDPRVLAITAAERLTKKGKRAYPKLLEHLDDNRQSVAFRRVIPHDVGDACFCIIRNQIFPLPQDYRGSFYRTGSDNTLHARPFFLKPALFDRRTLPKWLDERKDKTLRDMQIEALSWLIAQERTIGFRIEKDKADFLYPLERRLEEIESGKPWTNPDELTSDNPFEF